jgi:hypothetical protein
MSEEASGIEVASIARVRLDGLLADGERLAVAALDHFNCAALLTMRPHCALAVSIRIC